MKSSIINYQFTLSKLKFLRIIFLRIIWKQLLWYFFTGKKQAPFLRKWFFFDVFAFLGNMFKYQNFVRIILLLMAFVILMSTSTVIKLLSACVSIWTESHQICKVWALLNQVHPRCFCSYGFWLNKSSHRVKQVSISESTNINQSISINRFYPIEAIHRNAIFSIRFLFK